MAGVKLRDACGVRKHRIMALSFIDLGLGMLALTAVPWGVANLAADWAEILRAVATQVAMLVAGKAGALAARLGLV